MKKAEKFNPELRGLIPEELSSINGGSFAYDLGTLLRFLGIYYGNGMGAPGYASATADYVVNKFNNE